MATAAHTVHNPTHCICGLYCSSISRLPEWTHFSAAIPCNQGNREDNSQVVDFTHSLSLFIVLQWVFAGILQISVEQNSTKQVMWSLWLRKHIIHLWEEEEEEKRLDPVHTALYRIYQFCSILYNAEAQCICCCAFLKVLHTCNLSIWYKNAKLSCTLIFFFPKTNIIIYNIIRKQGRWCF